MQFKDFLTKKYPLYVNPEMKVNLTVSQLCELVEEWENEKLKQAYSNGLINATSSMIERISNDLAKVKIRNAEPNTRQQIHNGARIACLSSVLNYLKQKKESYIKNSNKTI